jgi:hypothetical protein
MDHYRSEQRLKNLLNPAVPCRIWLVQNSSILVKYFRRSTFHHSSILEAIELGYRADLQRPVFRRSRAGWMQS